ncbi:MAG: GAF domain-containing sensor histidine kinase [Alphaproteobacteria bacterium]|nr:GAF domain-containing sensor histidine kinase [Alphaproteobacteria bacterium]
MDPVEQLPWIGPAAPGITDLERIEAALHRAREAGDAERIAAAAGALSDHHLERGHIDRAEAALAEGLAAAQSAGLDAARVPLDRREAWLGHLRGAPDATTRLMRANARATELGLGVEAIITSLYLGLIRARIGKARQLAATISESLAQLRAQPTVLPRVALLAALAFEEAGQTDRAQVEALRVRILADTRGDARLAEAATALLDRFDGTASADARIQQLVSVAIEVSRKRVLEEVLQTIVWSTIELLDADRAFVIRPGADGPVVVASASRDGEPGVPSMSIAKRALELGREVVSPDLGDDSALARAKSIMSLQLRTAICVPMSDGANVLGALYADSRRASKEELHDLAWLVRAFASHAAAAVVNAEHHEEQRRAVQHARETSHDVRNLVSTLRMGLDTLEEEAGLEPWAESIVQELGKVSRLIERQVAMLLSGKREDPVELELDKLVQRVCELSRFDARKKGVSIEVRDVPARILGRSDDLTRLVANLVGNAIKYAPEGTVVEVTLSRRRANDRTWGVLRVRDRGPGIPEGELQRIFESGVQAAGHHEGYGLGLGICRRLVDEAHGGIRALNADGGGALFEVVLPLAPGG